MLKKIAERIKVYSNYLLILLFVFLLASFVRNIVKTGKAKKQIQEAETRVEKLREEGRQLSEKVQAVKSQEYIEKQLRDKLGLAKEGETVVVLPDDEILRKLAPTRLEEEETLPDPTWRKWAKLFGLF